MDKIYCIASGEYSDWNINYCFKSKEKRDKILEFLDNRDYYEYDLDLDDDDRDLNTFKTYYCAEIWKDDEEGIEVYFFKTNNFFHEFKKIRHSKYGDFILNFVIKKEEFDKGSKYYKSKYEKIWNDTMAKIKYMKEVEGLSNEEISEILNSQ